MSGEWYRTWRHDERAHELRAAVELRYRRREKAMRIVGALMLVGAIVAFAWAPLPA